MQPALGLLRSYRRAYLALNLAFYGLVILGTLYAFANPAAQANLTQLILEGFSAPPLSIARDAYLSKNVLEAAAATFLVNTLLGSFATITLPSLLVPFVGVVIGLYRALIWGVALAPTDPELARAMIPHSITLLLEGQGYILAMFAVHVLWMSAFDGLRRETRGFLAGYLAGLRSTLTTYRLIVLLLAIAAFYEAFELIYLVGMQ